VGTALTAHGAFGPGAVLLRAAIEDLRARGQLGLLARALVSQAWSAIYLGRWSEALSAAEEAGRLACETAQPRWATAAGISTATVMGLRGEPGAEALAAEAEAVLLPTGAQFMLALVQIARGTAALGAGRHADAYAHLRRLFDPADVAHHPHARLWALPDLAEAAVRSGHGAEARTVLAEVEALEARPAPGVVHVGIAAARALLADDGQAERLFAAALAEDLSGWPFVRARLLLAQGAGLRRRRRVAESRGPLRAAREAFDALGASPWAARARQELRASGETSRRRTRDVLEQLTPQELQVATMAAAGLSNREIGEKLFLSHRTVGSHLYRTFPKLGITSRADLPAALGAARLLDPARPPAGRAID
jgi:ATP/maltotriose-dependent transcriptional regulator MalT